MATMLRLFPCWAALGLTIVNLLGCAATLAPCARPAAGTRMECPVAGEPKRAFTLHVPANWDGHSSLPVVVAFHGGGGSRASADRVTCPGGATDSPLCFSARAQAHGFAVVLPDGTGSRVLSNVRTWNAGGGHDDWNCTSGHACQSGVNDAAYFDALLQEVGALLPIDNKRIFLTGLSNGGAMAHRLACERSAVVAAIATVGAGNQFAAAGGACPNPVPVLHIHGTADPCWTYETSQQACSGDNNGRKIGAEPSVAGWVARNKCSATFADEDIPDAASDGTRTTRRTWQGCSAPVQLLRVDGGGHTWPGGHPYLPTKTVGPVSQDFEANLEILKFFQANPRP
ncbi:MAG: hypothetical protein HY902_01770 [Deltaproteobacteria bacterium]|nr:hypothetical protein [Deltaproteobacteria bacterium]